VVDGAGPVSVRQQCFRFVTEPVCRISPDRLRSNLHYQTRRKWVGCRATHRGRCRGVDAEKDCLTELHGVEISHCGSSPRCSGIARQREEGGRRV
jgi:hypothetical protein